MSDAWPEPAVDLVQAIADTKLLLSHRFAQWSLAGPSLEDDIGGASAAQEEIGHARQLFRLLEQQGRDADWLRGDREADAFCNAACLDAVGDDWVDALAAVGPADRAAWYLLDAIDHDDFRGLVEKMGEDEYFHLEYHDARLETLAEEQPDAVEAALSRTLPGALALLGPSDHDDPVHEAGFTTRSTEELRDAFADHYRSLFADTPVSLDGVDWDAPSVDGWDEARRRADGGSISGQDLAMLRGSANREFLVE
jgi:ring-1,2-phenylacetyl-CoA epoxidase subunit PaaC